VPRPTLLLRRHGSFSALQHHTARCDRLQQPPASESLCVLPARCPALNRRASMPQQPGFFVSVTSFCWPAKLCIVANQPTNQPSHSSPCPSPDSPSRSLCGARILLHPDFVARPAAQRNAAHTVLRRAGFTGRVVACEHCPCQFQLYPSFFGKGSVRRRTLRQTLSLSA
jgi:hypothetical protein